MGQQMSGSTASRMLAKVKSVELRIAPYLEPSTKRILTRNKENLRKLGQLQQEANDKLSKLHTERHILLQVPLAQQRPDVASAIRNARELNRLGDLAERKVDLILSTLKVSQLSEHLVRSSVQSLGREVEVLKSFSTATTMFSEEIDQIVRKHGLKFAEGAHSRYVTSILVDTKSGLGCLSP